ncbi:MAG: hypothetical protein U0527_07275 [Candidatus Eisenbacteria bacterium]
MILVLDLDIPSNAGPRPFIADENGLWTIWQPHGARLGVGQMKQLPHICDRE